MQAAHKEMKDKKKFQDTKVKERTCPETKGHPDQWAHMTKDLHPPLNLFFGDESISMQKDILHQPDSCTDCTTTAQMLIFNSLSYDQCLMK